MSKHPSHVGLDVLRGSGHAAGLPSRWRRSLATDHAGRPRAESAIDEVENRRSSSVVEVHEQYMEWNDRLNRTSNLVDNVSG